jgi:hypothetical protein
LRNVETLDTDGEIVTRGGEDAREGEDWEDEDDI